MTHRNIPEHWQFGRSEKYSPSGVVRCVHPRDTVLKALSVAANAGITRVAEVTRLDRLGIPNFMTVRPRDLDPGISYYNGKGTTRADAYAGALMEAIERHGGESCDYPVVEGAYAQLTKRRRCVNPAEVLVPKLGHYSDDLPLEWVEGFDIVAMRPTLVPLNFVVCPYKPAATAAPFMASTNGLASGNTLPEALCHALCEVIERDAQAISMARTTVGPMARALLDGTCANGAVTKGQRCISLEGLPRRAGQLVSKMKSAGLRIYLRDATETAGIATIDCTIVDDEWTGTPNAHGGCGAHPDARVALLRALTEAAQSRITCIQGGREDLPQIMSHNRCNGREAIEGLFGSGEVIRFKDIPSVEHRRIDEDLEFLLERLPRWGLHEVVAFDLTHPSVGMPVVRLVVPNAETWAVCTIFIQGGESLALARMRSCSASSGNTVQRDARRRREDRAASRAPIHCGDSRGVRLAGRLS